MSRERNPFQQEINEGLDQRRKENEATSPDILPYDGSIPKRRKFYRTFDDAAEQNERDEVQLQILFARELSVATGNREGHRDPKSAELDRGLIHYPAYLEQLSSSALQEERKLLTKILIKDLRVKKELVLVEAEMQSREWRERRERRAKGLESDPYVLAFERCLKAQDLEQAYEVVCEQKEEVKTEGFQALFEFIRTLPKETILHSLNEAKWPSEILFPHATTDYLKRVSPFLARLLGDPDGDAPQSALVGLSQYDRLKLAQDIGLYLGLVAIRACEIVEPIEEYRLLADLDIRSAFEEKCRLNGKEFYGGPYDPVRDMKVISVYRFFLERAEYRGDLDSLMRCADAIADRDFFRLDITRGNDPSIANEDYFSGVIPGEAHIAGYYPGVYFGVLSGHYYWNERERCVVQNVPLKFFLPTRALGELILYGERLAFEGISREDVAIDEVSKSVTHVIRGEPFFAPLGDPVNSKFERCIFAKHIPRAVLHDFQKYYPDATLEMKEITFCHDIDDLEQDREIKLSIPFIVLPKEASLNPLKVAAIGRFHDILDNVYINMNKKDI